MAKSIYLDRSELSLAYPISVSGTRIWAHQFPLLPKVAILLLMSLIPPTLSVLIISRTGVPSEIYTPLQVYLPGNPLPQFARNDTCDQLSTYSTSCLAHLQNHDIYWDYESRTYKIVRTTIAADNMIGDLIIAWGTPTGFDQQGISIVVSWGTRSALLATNSFQPYSRVRFIEYDTEPLKRSQWHGFVGHKSDDLSQ